MYAVAIFIVKERLLRALPWHVYLKGNQMASKHEVRCINKSDRYNAHERIKAIGGVNGDGTNWKLSQQEAISAIEAGKYQFFVKAGGRIVDVIVAVSRYGHKYLKTTSDGDEPNNLLSLYECVY